MLHTSSGARLRHRSTCRMMRIPYMVSDTVRSANLPDRAEKQRLVDQIRPWHHSIRVDDGVVTQGGKTLQHHLAHIGRLPLPDLAGKSVLDLAAWDGYYPFMAEGAGASR